MDFKNYINNIHKVLEQIVVSPRHLSEVSKQNFMLPSVALRLFSDDLQ